MSETDAKQSELEVGADESSNAVSSKQQQRKRSMTPVMDEKDLGSLNDEFQAPASKKRTRSTNTSGGRKKSKRRRKDTPTKAKNKGTKRKSSVKKDDKRKKLKTDTPSKRVSFDPKSTPISKEEAQETPSKSLHNLSNISTKAFHEANQYEEEYGEEWYNKYKRENPIPEDRKEEEEEDAASLQGNNTRPRIIPPSDELFADIEPIQNEIIVPQSAPVHTYENSTGEGGEEEKEGDELDEIREPQTSLVDQSGAQLLFFLLATLLSGPVSIAYKHGDQIFLPLWGWQCLVTFLALIFQNQPKLFSLERFCLLLITVYSLSFDLLNAQELQAVGCIFLVDLIKNKYVGENRREIQYFGTLVFYLAVALIGWEFMKTYTNQPEKLTYENSQIVVFVKSILDGLKK